MSDEIARATGFEPVTPGIKTRCLEFLGQSPTDSVPNAAKFNHSSFCVLPFYGIEYPANTFCCLVPSTADRNKIKSKILAGERADECSACWRLEDLDVRSDRQIKNESFDYHTGRSMQELYNDLMNDPDPDFLCVKIDTNNTCNATCVTCNPFASTAWGKLMSKSIIPIRSIEHSSLNLNYKDLKSIMFRGGEPLLSKHNFDILDNLHQSGNHSCMVSVVTNGSIWPTQKQLDTLMKFKNLIVSFSIDGVEDVFNYLRYPLQWSDVVANLRRWQNFGIQLGVSYTVSNLNVLYHDRTKQWFEGNQLEYLVNFVRSPKHFSIDSLPAGVKQTIKSILTDKTMANMFRPHLTEDDLQFARFCENIAYQDSLKNISIKNYLPDLAKLLQL